MTARLTSAAVVLALVFQAALAIVSERHKSAVFDEIIHLPPGYAIVKMGETVAPMWAQRYG